MRQLRSTSPAEKIFAIDFGLIHHLTAMIYKYVFVFAIVQCIVLENVCNGQFHWAKHGNDNARMRELIRELLRDDGSSYKVFDLYHI